MHQLQVNKKRITAATFEENKLLQNNIGNIKNNIPRA